MKKLVYEKIDKNIILYAKNPVHNDDLIITKRILSQQIIYPDEFSILKDDSVIQVIVAPTIHELLDLGLKEILQTMLDWGNRFRFGRMRIYFRIPTNHPLVFEQIKFVKNLINDLNDYIKNEFKSPHMHSQIKMFLEKEITFGKKSSSIKLTCSFKNGIFEIIKNINNRYHRYLFDKQESNKHINDDTDLLLYLKSNTSKAILNNFKSDKELLDFFKKEYMQINDNDPKTIKLNSINITTNEKNIDKLKENITNTIKETFGVDEEHVHVMDN